MLQAALMMAFGSGPPGQIQNVASAFGFGSAVLSLLTDGTYTASGSAGGNWVEPPAAAEHWEVRASLTAGSLSSGATGSWLDFSSNRSWATTGNESATMTLEWRDKYTGTVRHTQTGIEIASTT